MTEARRRGLRYGRRPPKNAPALRLGTLLTGVLPEHPETVDYLVRFAQWNVLGNDRYGDCVAVTGANMRRVMTVHAGEEIYPDLDQVIAFYRTQNPGFPNQDEGMVIQTALEELNKAGEKYFDGSKALAFAKVDHTKPDEVKAAIAIFGGLWVGITVTEENMHDFDLGQPWDWVMNSPIDGGHSVLVGGYDSDGTGADERFITWGRETGFTDAFWAHQVDEAWVVIWPEHLKSPAFLEGVDQQKLAEDYQMLTGRTFPEAPVPTPVVPPAPPAPVPPPVPEPPVEGADAELVLAANEWLSHRHSSKVNTAFVKAVCTWLEEKGYPT